MTSANDNAGIAPRPTIGQLVAAAKAALGELRDRGRSLGIECDRDHHADALSAIESLASSARVAEMIRRTEPANNAGE